MKNNIKLTIEHLIFSNDLWAGGFKTDKSVNLIIVHLKDQLRCPWQATRWQILKNTETKDYKLQNRKDPHGQY